MNIFVKKFSKKSLSLLIALIMVFSALPLTPPISADAAEVKTNIDVWDASRAGTNSNTGQYRYSYADSKTGKTLSGIQWNGLTHNSTYLTVNNSALSFAEINTTGVITGNDNIADLGIRGNKWSFSAKFAYTGSSTKTTVFGLSSTTKRNYTRSNDGGGTGLANGYVADLVDIRADGTVYINNTWSSTVSGISSADLVATSATAPKTLTVTYDNGNLTIDIDGTQKISQTVDTALFSAGVGNYLAGPNVQVFSGGTAPYYQVTNNSAYLWNFNLYSLSGATYGEASASESSIITNPGNLTLHWLASKDYTKDASKNTYDINSQSNVTWEITNDVPSLTFNGNSSVQRSFGQTINNTGISSSIESGGAGVTIAFMAYTNNQYDTPFFTIYGDRTEFSYSPSGRILYRNSSYSASNSATQNIQNTSAISTGTWHKIVIVLKASKSMDVYVDSSTAIKSISNNDFYDNNTWNTSHTIKLGANKDGTEKFNGAIRDFRIYNKSLTTSADITSLMSDMESNKANTKSYKVSAVSEYGLLGQSQPGTVRLQNGDMNVVNDGYAGNTTIGILRIPLSDFQPGDMAGSESKLLLNVASTWYNTNSNQSSSIKSRYENELYTDVYYTTNDVSNYVRSSGTRSALSTIALNTNYSASIATVKSNVALLGASDATKIGSIPHTTIGQYSLDVANAINATLNANKSDLYIILVKNAVDGYGNDQNGPWTDTHFLINQQGISYTKVRNYSFVNFNGDIVKEVQASSAMEAAEYTPTEVKATWYQQPTNIPFRHTKYTYYWPNTPTDNVFREQESSTDEDCTNEFVNVTSTTHDVVCQFCKHTETLNHAFRQTSTVPSGDVNNGYDVYTCSNCNYAKNEYFDTDWSAYNAEKIVAQEEIQNTAKYTAESIKNVTDIIQQVTPNVETKSQKYINDMTTALTDAVRALVLNQYSITVNYVDENGNDLAVGEGGTTSKIYPAVDYGSIQNIVAPTNYNKVDYAVYKWTREDKSNSSISGLNSSSLDVVVKGASTYYVFLKKTTVDDTLVGDNAVITLNNKSNKVVDIGYVSKETPQTVTVDTTAGTIKIGNTTLTAPKYSFYNLTGFEINNEPVANGETITINSKMVIRPVYEAKKTVRITRATGSNFLINGQDVPSIDVEWNKKIVASTENSSSVIWKAGVDYDGNGTIEDSEKNVVAYGSTYTFYSNSNVTIYTETSASAPAVPTASIGIFSYDATDNKVTVVNNFYVPDGMKATKAGVILSTKNSTREALIAQTNGKFEGDESQFTTDKNQIRISVSRTANTSFTMYALAYVVASDGQTYYAPTVQSITYTVKNS